MLVVLHRIFNIRELKIPKSLTCSKLQLLHYAVTTILHPIDT